MTTLTVTQIQPATDAAKAIVRLANERNQTVQVEVYRDGSHGVVDGAAWLVKAACKDLGSTKVKHAMMRVARGEGAETLRA